MDANGTRYHLLLGEHDWLPPASPPTEAVSERVEWDGAAHALMLEQLLFTFPTPAGSVVPGVDDRRGGAADRFGNWYWITADSTEIRVQSVGDGVSGHFWSGGDDAVPSPRSRPTFEDAPGAGAPLPPLSLSGLAVTDDHYLVVGTRAPGGLLVFDLRGGGGPIRSVWPLDVPFAPFDLCRRHGGGVWILDREHHTLWGLDRTFAVMPLGPPDPRDETPDFGPVAGSATPAVPTAEISRGAAVELTGDPIAVDTAEDGTLYLLSRTGSKAPSEVQLLRDGVSVGPAMTLEDSATGISVVGQDLAVVGDTCYVVDADGNQAYAFELHDGALRLVHRFFPMRLYGGKALASSPAGPYYDVGDAFVPLVEQHRPRFEQDGTLQTRVFDGREPGCVWHRLLLDAWIPAGASVTIESRAADDKRTLPGGDWRREPGPIERTSGAELPFLRLRPEGSPATHELLFQAARGRYLQLRLHIEGDGRVSPRLRALRIWYPRFSYLDRYLPRIYREDPGSASFLDRYLANTEGILTPLEDAIASVQALLDPRTAPADALAWIASFFDVALDPAWSEARRRLFIRHATEFYTRRGTIRGLGMALSLAIADCADESVFADEEPVRTQAARIVERFRIRSMPAVVLGDPTEDEGPRFIASADRWTPDQGRDVLNRRYADYTGDPGAQFPLDPAQAVSRAVWARFADDTLGFEPAAAADEDAGAWHDFLRRRYRTVDALNSDYGTFGAGRHADFDSIPLPSLLPPDGAPLADWYQFETIVLPTRRLAHRFTVLLPVRPGSTNQNHEERMALAQRIVDLQKPAHTVFTVRFYWSAFRVGEARLGSDTLIDRGSRSPALLGPAVLGHSSIGESTLGGEPPTPLPVPIRQELP
jgi:phage tail-like protein